jgi:predicted nucleic acid-binding protein
MQTRISAARYVVDASVAIKWYLNDEEHVDEARAILAAYVVNDIAFLAPDHIRYEVPNAILASVRRRRLDLPTAKLAVSNFLATRISTASDYTLLTSAYDYAVRYDCAFYDALYLAMADRFDCSFVHADRRLRNTLGSRFERELWIEDFAAGISG